jgi:hypothetical protein
MDCGYRSLIFSERDWETEINKYQYTKTHSFIGEHQTHFNSYDIYCPECGSPMVNSFEVDEHDGGIVKDI